MTFFGLMALLVSSGPAAAAQAPKAAKPAATSATKLTSAQSAALKLGWDNLWRGYADLLSTPPDVKGDTSRLEGHMKAAMDLLHQIDPAHLQAAPAKIPIEDKGNTRAFVMNAVKGHLDKASSVIEGAKVSHPDIQKVIANINVAETELGAAAAAPQK
jgi:hypothetical protein